MVSADLRRELARLHRLYAAALRQEPLSVTFDLPQSLAEHAARAAFVQDRIARGPAVESLGRSLFDSLPFPAVVLDEQLQVSLSNRAWATDEAAQDWLRGVREPRCRYRKVLVDSIREGGRAFLAGKTTGLGRALLLVPLALRLPSVGPRALLVAGRSLHRSGPFPEGAQLLFGLTPAEAAVAEAVLIGRSLEEIAAARQTTVQTVRFQMKRVLAKTGVSTRTHLTQLLLNSLWQPSLND